MDTIPTWLGAVGALFVIAAALGSAVAIYRTNLQGTSLREAERTIERLRGEISDYERREHDLDTTVQVQRSELTSAGERIKVLEDLITKRQDDDEIKAEIAGIREVVNENVLPQLMLILRAIDKEGSAA